jgi:hypothetical protein
MRRRRKVGVFLIDNKKMIKCRECRDPIARVRVDWTRKAGEQAYYCLDCAYSLDLIAVVPKPETVWKTNERIRRSGDVS